MSTSDQQGSQPLTRKQLRELRLTGATPVISDEAAAAAAAAAPLPRAAEPVEIEPAPQVEPADHSGDSPMTRRQARVHERIRTASMSIIDTTSSDSEASDDAPAAESEILSGVPEFEPIADSDTAAEGPDVVEDADVVEPVIDDAPIFVPVLDEDDEGVDDELVEVAPVSAAATADQPFADRFEAESADAVESEPVAPELDEPDEPAPSSGPTPVVTPTFGQELLEEQSDVPAFAPSFDELITSDSGGSQHNAPNTLIFTPSPGEGSLSGPVASTGEMLVTGSYELPQGLGSQGHAIGTTDGKESDAVLIDGELPPASSPTPIAASSAVSTIKPAGEVIRPPAPEKGNKLMLTLAITAGGLALVLAAALVLAFTMKLF